MEHYAENIPGFFNHGDFGFYGFCVANAPQTAHFVEIGSYKGRSSSFMAVEIIRSGKQIRFDCVDTWQGSIEHQAGQSHEDPDVVSGLLYETFLENMRPVAGRYNAVRMPSVQAAEIYGNDTLDWVFIDASHDYDNVVADIRAWLPKVRPGGMISGHDHFHGPVKQAVADTIGAVDGAGDCWYHVKK